MTYEYRKKLEFISNYLEKEKLLGRDVKFESERLYRKLSKKKLWKKFVYKKFQRNQYVTEYLRDKIENMTFNDMRGVTFDIVLARKIIGELKPKVLLTLTDPDTKVLPYIDEAKKMGVKTVCLQHGAIYPFDAPAIYPESEYFIAWSKTSGNWLNRSTHFKSMKMLLGQSPFHQKPKIYTNKKQMRGLSILYLNTAQLVDHSIINYYLKRLFDELAISKRKIKLFLRMHPNQLQFSFNLNWLTGNSNLKIIWANNESLDELLKKVDIVIFENTTAGFDAMLLGKPTIYFNPYTGEDFFNVVRHKASLSILRNEEIGPKLLKFLENKKLYEEFSKNGKSYAQSYLGLSYNDSVNKITSSITEIVNV